MVYLVDTIGILGSGQSPRFTVSGEGGTQHSHGGRISNRDQTHQSQVDTELLGKSQGGGEWRGPCRAGMTRTGCSPRPEGSCFQPKTLPGTRPHQLQKLLQTKPTTCRFCSAPPTLTLLTFLTTSGAQTDTRSRPGQGELSVTWMLSHPRAAAPLSRDCRLDPTRQAAWRGGRKRPEPTVSISRAG